MKSIEWDYTPLIQKVQQLKVDTSNLELSLSSLDGKYNMFLYHHEEVVRLASAACPSQRDSPPDGTKLLHAEAHLIAAAQVTHSMGDVMAHAVYYALGLNVDDSKFQNLGFGNIAKHLPDAIYVALGKQICSCCSSQEYSYLTAFVNVTKHRSLVSTIARVTETQAHTISTAILVSDFLHKSNSYPSKTSKDFLDNTMPNVIGDVINVGRTLEEVIGGQ